jgi:predicted dehydrogenase
MTSIGILGTGMIANVHAEAAHAIGTNVVAVRDPRKEKTSEFSSKHDCEVEESAEALLSRTDIDGVVIAVPNDQHASLAIQALQAGHHVLLEKPMAMSLAQCEEIISTRDSSGKVLQMGFVCRYSPAAIKAKELIESGKIGEVLHVQATLLRQRGIPGIGGWFTTKDRSGGGCLIDIGVHLIDVAMHITSCTSPTRVSGTCNQAFTIDSYAYKEMWSTPKLDGTFDVEDRIRASIRDESGVTFRYDVSWATHLPENTMRDGLVIEGSEGALVIDLWTDELTRGFSENGAPKDETISFDVTEAWDDAFQSEHRAFANAIKNGELDGNAGSGEDGRLVQSVVEAIYASNAIGKEIAVAK